MTSPQFERLSLAQATGSALANGLPLDALVRAFFESGFAADLGRVRIHTDRAAAAAANALQARAFTLGVDIFFAEGEYRPETPEGLHLLAHELVHVVQQGPNPSPQGSCVVGPAGDPLESEADLVARQLLSGDPISPISRDACPGVIRRVVVADGSSARITIKNSAVPAVYTYPFTSTSQSPAVNTHLTKGFTPGTTPTLGGKASAAWTATGEVDISLDPGDTGKLPGIVFGFMQFQKINQISVHYAGRMIREGGIELDIGEPPALPRKFGRDRDKLDPNPPWSSFVAGDKAFDAVRNVAVAETGDHPQFLVQAVLANKRTGSDNYLVRLIDDRQFLTVFAVRFPPNVYQILAYFEWSAVWSYEFGWTLGGVPIPIKGANTSFKMGTVTTGKLPPALSTGQLLNPTAIPLLGHLETEQAIQQTLKGGTVNRMDAEERFGVIPASFNP